MITHMKMDVLNISGRSLVAAEIKFWQIKAFQWVTISTYLQLLPYECDKKCNCSISDKFNLSVGIFYKIEKKICLC